MPIQRLGKRPFCGIRPDTRRFSSRFRSSTSPGIPPAPPAANWGAKVSAWEMMLNDRFGDCACAGIGHAWMTWTSNAGALWTPSAEEVLSLYRVFNPGTEDDGCNLQDVLAYLKANGFAGHPLNDFAILNAASVIEVEDAINLFGCAYVGIALPDSVLQGEDLLANPWDTPGAIWTPNPNNGHCVLAVAYDGNGMTVVTWGAIKRMSWDFWAACGDEAYALDAPAWFDANGRSPSGYSSDDLNADLQAIPSVADPSVEPGNFSPVPPPSPS